MIASPLRPQECCGRAALCIALALGLACVTSLARAEEPQPSVSQDATYTSNLAATSSAQWEYSIAPYVWLAGLNGDLGGSGPVPDIHVDTPFADILHALKFGGMAMGTARYDRFIAVGDVTYLELANSRNLDIRDPGLLTGSAKVKQFMSTVAGGYRAVDKGPVLVDLLAGLRVVAIHQNSRLSGPSRSVSGGASKTLVDPIVGARLSGPLGGAWGYDLYGDVGGFGASSKLTWQLMGLVKYEISPSWALAAGWRHLAIDTSKNGFKSDVAMDGPLLGARYRF